MRLTTTQKGDKPLKKVAMFFAGLTLLLSLRVGLNAASFCLRRFKINDDFFSLYVSRVHNAMEIGCLMAVIIMTIYQVSYGKHMRKISIAGHWAFFLNIIALLAIFVTGGERGHETLFYYALIISAFVYGANQVCAFDVGGDSIPYFVAAMPVSGILVSIFQVLFLKKFGDRTLYETDFLLVTFQLAISIMISMLAAALWTWVFMEVDELDKDKAEKTLEQEEGGTPSEESWHVISPMVMCILGLGLIYAIYPAVAPGLLVHFSYVNKIDMVILVVSAIPSLVVVIISECTSSGPNKPWKEHPFWHAFLLAPLMELILAILFLRVLHYKGTVMSMAILNKPVTAGIFTVIFFTCHTISLAIGFPGVNANNKTMNSINLLVALILMNIMEFLGEGYVIEFKRHSYYNWPTARMTHLEGFVFWMRNAFYNAIKSLKTLLTKDLRADIVGQVAP